MEIFYKLAHSIYSQRVRKAARTLDILLGREDTVQEMVITCYEATSNLDPSRNWWEIADYYMTVAWNCYTGLCRKAFREQRAPEQEVLSLSDVEGKDLEPAECVRQNYINAIEPQAKRLEDWQVMAIRRSHFYGVSIRQLAEDYGKSRSTISRIVRGQSWKKV